jgi:hypothetical protein
VVAAGGGGGGLEGQLGGRLWLGPLVMRGTVTVSPGLFSPTESAALMGAGLTFGIGPTSRVTVLAERGVHHWSRFGEIFDDSTATATLPCWGARVVIEGPPGAPWRLSHGLAMFVLKDAGSKEVNAAPGSFAATSSYRAGGVLAGAVYQVGFGS